MFIDLLLPYTKENQYIKFQPPVTEDEIQDAEKQFQVRFPDELRAFLRETNGDNFLCLSLNSIIETNLRLRREIDPALSDVSQFLFIATNGCGDYYGYKIDHGTIQSTDFYIWEHEEFRARIVAANLADLINRYYQDQI